MRSAAGNEHNASLRDDMSQYSTIAKHGPYTPPTHSNILRTRCVPSTLACCSYAPHVCQLMRQGEELACCRADAGREVAAATIGWYSAPQRGSRSRIYSTSPS
ncbi:hypothetical protein CVIRNUC_003880 [Coccomyxa viridis]|uniref:Uncharacterized protein n=1 Tax=Coccomyxa viridis TaxID=1274662 RepID=A0AAV1I2U9_9CHLO|nr:hypothetical protein CVIRNUC_003880 [Coccomyxa viridis]